MFERGLRQHCKGIFCSLSSRCDGKTSCRMAVNSHVFGDPCPGTKKYVEVHYACLRDSKTTTKVGKHWPSSHVSSDNLDGVCLFSETSAPLVPPEWRRRPLEPPPTSAAGSPEGARAFSPSGPSGSFDVFLHLGRHLHRRVWSRRNQQEEKAHPGHSADDSR